MRKLLLASALLVSGTVAVHAADLIVDEAPAMAAPAADPSIYVQLLGGAVAGLDYTFYNAESEDDFDDATDVGYAIAGTIGVVVSDGLSVEGDILYTNRVLPDFDDSTISSLSFMGNLKYTAELSEGFALYGAAGLGYITYVDHFEGEDYDYSGFGYQLIGGLSAEVADNVSLLGEVRYQNTFGNATSDDFDDEISVPTVSVLAGIKLGF